MTFPTVEYIDWIEDLPSDPTHDLTTTGLRAHRDEQGSDIEGRLIDEQSAEEQSLESLLASEYGVEERQVVVTAGATEAYLLALAAGDVTDGEVLVERPGFEPHWSTPKGFDATVERFDRPANDGFDLDPDRVAAATGDATAMVVVSNRHNPSGRLVGRDRLRSVADAAGSARLLVDEVYAPYTDEHVSGAFGGPTGAGLDDVVVVNSLSKLHGYRELRLGWLIGDPAFAQRARETAVHFGGPSSLARRFAAGVLAGEETARARSQFEAHANRLERFLDRRPDLDSGTPTACSYAFPAHDRSDGETVATAAQSAGVLVVPGTFFGAPDRFRIGVGGSPEEMDAALDALGAVLDDC